MASQTANSFFFTQTLSFKEAKSLLPNITESKYYAAKNHAKNVGPGLPVGTTSTRKRMDPVKLDSFLDFITSPHVIRDLPYGERKIKLSDGTVYEMPNVIRCMGSSDVIQQYKAYCSENNISPLGDSTMYRILSECGAQIRTSLEGIDYFIAEGGRAFRTILEALEELLKFQVLNQQEKKDFSALFLQCEQYLRADFKVHISPDSKVADHCQTFALSDPLHPEFAVTCQHHHDLVCVTCEQMKDAISSLMKTIQCSCNHGLTDSLRDLQFKLQNATQSITNLKRHLIRCRNQDAAKSDLFDTMQHNEVLLICDWSMKYLPRKYREDQSDWFGKRGLPWHITMAFHKTETCIESLGFVHIFQSQVSQDSITTAAIIINVMENIQSIDASISSFHVWSDNAGCYKSTEMMALLKSHGLVRSFNFCEAQNGKGPCDRTGATLKSAIRRFVNQGHDVLTAHSMKEAIEKTAKNVKYRVSVSEVASQKTSFKPIPAISSYSNFVFEEEGIRVWKAYGIGTGLLIPNTAIGIPSMEHLPLTFLEQPEDIGFHMIKVNTTTETEKTFHCPNEGCVAAFGSSEDLSNHLLFEKCNLELELSSSSIADLTKRKYVTKISHSENLNLKLCLTEDTETQAADSELNSGWALKDERHSRRFNENQREFLVQKFNVGLQTGKKEDPFILSDSMMYERRADGTRRFSYDEILSMQQITSFFSRMSKKNKMAEAENWEAKKETEISKIRANIIDE